MGLHPDGRPWREGDHIPAWGDRGLSATEAELLNGVRRPASDRPSPRGGGPAPYAVQRAIALIEVAQSPEPWTPHAMAAWIGRATVVLEELTRDA